MYQHRSQTIRFFRLFFLKIIEFVSRSLPERKGYRSLPHVTQQIHQPLTRTHPHPYRYPYSHAHARVRANAYRDRPQTEDSDTVPRTCSCATDDYDNRVEPSVAGGEKIGRQFCDLLVNDVQQQGRGGEAGPCRSAE